MNSGSKYWPHAGGSARVLPHRWLVAQLLLRLSPHSVVEGFDIVALNDQLTTLQLRKLGETLELIAHVAPTRYSRIRRDIRRIMLVRAGGPEYWPFADGLIINAAYVDEAPIEQIALTIVHEAVHARLWHRGFRYQRHLRERIESICVEAEVAFAMNLPGSQPLLVDYARAKLSTPWWTETEVFERRLRAREKLGWPSWLLRLHEALFRPRGASTSSKTVGRSRRRQ